MKNLLLESQGFYIFNLYVTWYGILIALGMTFGIIFACFLCKKKGYDKNMPLNLALFALPLAIVGARIYYCVFNGVESFWDVFKIWQGGMAIYGGVIGGFFGVLICCKIEKYSLLEACDVAVPCLILGQAIGRIGCYFAGCCYGVETTLPALQFFPLSVKVNGVWHLSTMFYESFLDLIGFFVLAFIFLKSKKSGITTASYFIIYGLIRAFLEEFRDPAELLTIGSTGIKVSQALSILLVILGVVLIFIFRKKEAETNVK